MSVVSCTFYLEGNSDEMLRAVPMMVRLRLPQCGTLN